MKKSIQNPNMKDRERYVQTKKYDLGKTDTVVRFLKNSIVINLKRQKNIQHL